MRAQLKGLHSPDVPDLTKWRPGEKDFCFLLQMKIGPSKGDGYETFDAIVCTPGWYALYLKDQKICSGEHTLLMASYDYNALVEFIEKRVQACEAPDWHRLATQLRSLGRWEFADYSGAR